MANRKLAGGALLMLGLLVPMVQYRYLLAAVGAAGATSSAEAAFWHTAHSLLLWNIICGLCSLALIASGSVLLLTKRRHRGN